MSEKWTKGPWVVVSSGFGRHEIADGEGSVLAEAFGDDDDSRCWPISANAALIAAAPELYEALEKLKKHIEDGEEFNSRGYGPSTGINGDECLDIIAAALKKARGEKE